MSLPPPARPGAPRRSLLDRWRDGVSSPAATPAAADDWYAALFAQVDDGLLLCSADARVLSANPAAVRLLGRSTASLVGQPLDQLLLRHAADAQVPAGAPVSMRVAGTSCQVRVRVRPAPARDGAEQWFVHLRPVDQAADRPAAPGVAHHDAVTGLPDRALFRDRLDQALARARRSSRALALMVIDLDRFKFVNESLGRDAGDELLRQAARRLQRCLRGADTLARAPHAADAVDPTGPGPAAGPALSRLGGDAFTVLAESIGGADDAAALARRILEALGEPVAVGDLELVGSASVGIALQAAGGGDADTLLRQAEMAMHRAKSLGRGMYSFFSDDLNAAVSARLQLEGLLRRAAERGEFVLHYQPQCDLDSGRVTGVEALLRWHRPGHGLLAPDRFIAVLEDTGLILPVGAWVIRSACRQLAEWDREGLPPLRLAVNLSASQFRHPHLSSLVRDSLAEHAIDASRFEIELTESVVMEDTEATRNLLASFTDMGVGLAIDDFGTGHSSLAYLRRFRVDTLKIDRSFVQALPDSREDMAIARAVVALGRSMSLSVVAEGVETQAQADALRALDCDHMQGWLLARAMPASELGPWLRQRTCSGRGRLPLDDHGSTGEISRPMRLTL